MLEHLILHIHQLNEFLVILRVYKAKRADASISFVASSQWRQTDRLLDTLVGVLLELKNIWKSVVKKTNDTSLINKVSGSAKIRSQQLQDYLESIPMKMVASNQSTAQDTNRVFNGEKIADTQILGGYDYFDVDSMVEHSHFKRRCSLEQVAV